MWADMRFFKGEKCILRFQNRKNCPISGFSLGRLHMGGFVPPHMGGQSVNGGTHEGGHRPYGGPNFDRLYHKLKVLLMLSYNYTMQFIGYDSIKTR